MKILSIIGITLTLIIIIPCLILGAISRIIIESITIGYQYDIVNQLLLLQKK